jgi:hypothetical protein
MYKWAIAALLCVATMVGSNGMALAAGTDNQNLEDKVIDATGLSKKMDVQEVEAEIADAATEKTPVDPSAVIQELIDDYNMNGKGSLFLDKMSQDELYYTTATAVVFVDTNNKKWVNYRAMAYQDAVVQAQAQYMQFLGTSIRTSTLRELATDTEMPEFTQEELQSGSALASIYEKLVALGGAILDEQLEKRGIDPDEFKAAPPSKQKDLFRNAIETQTITTARGELTGMIPVKTFEANDDKGNYVVGVAVVASPKFRSRMKSIVTNKWDLPPNSKKVGGTGVRKQIIKDKMSLIQEFGIRQIYDEKGYPVLISYGQSGNLYTGDNAQMKLQYRNAAFDSARSDAYANFATLLKSSGQVENKDSKKAISRHIAKVTAEKGSLFESEETIQDYIQKTNSMVQIKGKVNNMPGIYELYKWTTTHPANGQEVNGVILAWSPKTANSAKKLAKAPKAKKAKSKTAAPASAAAGARSGSDLMDASDF